MMTKPVLLYYECLNYTEANKQLLFDAFELYILTDPRHDEKLSKHASDEIEVILLPHGFWFNTFQHERYPKLRVIASNTTSKPETDVDKDGVSVLWLNDKEFLNTITSTAEHTLALILAVHSRILEAHDYAMREWDRYRLGRPQMLSKQRLTIIGPGRVGKHLAKLADNIFLETYLVDKGTSDENKNGILDKTDVLAICANFEGDHNIVGRDELSQLPSDAIVVNTARGELLDTVTLIEMLEHKELRGAGLDVLPGDHCFPYERETIDLHTVRSYAQRNDNLILTPHIAGSTKDAWQSTQKRIILDVLEELK